MLSNIPLDLRYSLRQLRQNKVFTAVAILTLALGIGANTAIFSIIYSVLLRPLPFRDPGRLVLVSEHTERFPLLSASYQNFDDWRKQSRSFQEFGAVRNLTMSLTGDGEPEQIPSAMTTGNLFHLLGVNVVIGRSLAPSDDLPSSAPVAVLGYGLWQRRFNGSQPGGKTITLNSRPYSIVGVLPANFELLNQRPDVVIPMGPWASTLPNDRSWHPGIYPIARLKDGVPLAQARSEMSTIAKRLLAQYPDTNIAVDAIVNPMQEQIVSDLRPMLLTLFGAVVLVLLIACGNVANLLLTRATVRQREMSIRAAIGASNARILQQLLTEGILLSSLGALLGIGVAYAATSSLVHAAASAVPGIGEAHIDVHVLLFTAGISVIAGIFFGLAPAMHLRVRDLRAALNEGDRGAVGKHAKGLRSVLVVSEVALAMLLLIGAGLFLRSFARLANVSPGFSTEHILIADLPVSPAAYVKPVDRMNFFDAVLQRMRSLPGVNEAGAASFLPVSGGGSILHFNIQGRPPLNPSEYIMANYRAVSAGYRDVLKMPLLQGRWISESDRENTLPVVVINQTMAKTFFHGESPIGRFLQIGATPDKSVPWMQIVGVAGDVKQSLASDAPTEMYVPFRQADQLLPVYTLSMVIRTERDPATLINDVRSAVRQIDPNQPVVHLRTMEENVASSVARPRFRTTLLTIFAVVALLIAAVGIYGVMAYSTSQRSREMGIRMALGSSARQIFQLILTEGLRLTVLGVVIGAVGAFVVARYLKSLLFAVSTTDLLTLTLSTAVIVAVGLSASFMPARRASQVPITEVLREN